MNQGLTAEDRSDERRSNREPPIFVLPPPRAVRMGGASTKTGDAR
jgi:hypothetical protein